ncbi:MAG: outer membrane lipoprotein-sorting protein [Oligoflexales bacterium]|nr:outer membrane lipoprotein-sorting protein [Oligoflexales bacterium]
MRRIFFAGLFTVLLNFPALAGQQAQELLKEIDTNLTSKSIVMVSTMTISSERGDRSMKAKTWKKGTDHSFTEYLEPARERGIKMLKIKDDLWTYYPDADRIVKIAGHMLRQSMMGSDLSYEDMMENRKLSEMYDASVVEKAQYMERECLVMKLQARFEDVAYPSRKLWVDAERHIPLKSELYAKSGRLLKQSDVTEVKLFGKRWYPVNMIYKDMLKEGKGTRIAVDSIEFDQDIPQTRFNKSSLSK